MSPETEVVSFVLRFVYSAGGGPATTDELSSGLPAGSSAHAVATAREAQIRAAVQPGTGWYGVIRHVQTNEERRFTHWSEAVAFIERHVDLGEGTFVAEDTAT